jgi:hypothetical protein
MLRTQSRKERIKPLADARDEANLKREKFLNFVLHKKSKKSLEPELQRLAFPEPAPESHQ